MDYLKTMALPCGGKLVYRLPNCIEQIRFFVDSKWNSKTLLLEQVEGAIPFVSKYINSIDSEKYKSFDDILADRSNMTLVVDVILDIANQLDSDKKKS